jgi:hypothetical protein
MALFRVNNHRASAYVNLKVCNIILAYRSDVLGSHSNYGENKIHIFQSETVL